MVTRPRDPDPAQTMQRIRVGMTGLAVVLLLIGLASAVFSSANRNAAIAGGAKPEVVANLALDNGQDPASEPLAELGVAPSATVSNTAATTRK